MNNYETLYVLKPTLTDEETVSNIAKIEETLVRLGAQILATNKIGMRRLAYPVQKHERGFYTVVYFKAEGSVIAELERNLKFNEDVIKYLTVKYTNKKEIAHFKKLIDNANGIKEEQKKEDTSTNTQEEIADKEETETTQI